MCPPTTMPDVSAALEATEQLGAAGATHPRVSIADINAAIAEIHYVSGKDAIVGNTHAPSATTHDALNLLTICIVVMKNGFTIIGKSAPASPENFDRDKGRTFAYEDAVRQIWPLMGFALRDRLHSANGD